MPAPPDFPSPDPTGPGTPKKVRGQTAGPDHGRQLLLIIGWHLFPDPGSRFTGLGWRGRPARYGASPAHRQTRTAIRHESPPGRPPPDPPPHNPAPLRSAG